MQARTENMAPTYGLPPSVPMRHNGPVFPTISPAQLQYYLASASQYAPLPREDLSHAFSNLNFQGYNAGTAVKPLNGSTGNVGQAPIMHTKPVSMPMYYTLPDGRTYVSSVGQTQASIPQYNATTQAPVQSHYTSMVNNSGQCVPVLSQVNPYIAAQQNTADVPDLGAPRRHSFSSNEENGPQTPGFFGTQCLGDYGPNVTVPENSPQVWSTPSPQQLGGAFYPQQLSKMANGQYVLLDLDALCAQEPAIPRPIPAIFSGEKGRGTLERSLANPNNTTNVYIRGLHPDTTDEMLHSYGARFGTIESAKSMLDSETNLCKGFGFIKYFNFSDGENCIRGFFHWGYEAKWARMSHNEKLKTLGDKDNTNLYVSNIPMDNNFNEHSLMAIFDGYECLSAKILRDQNGLSRGVGFARFGTPDECYKIIKEYNGKPVGPEGQPIGIRFADTPDQKRLKTSTQERRQFKTHEYNVAAYGPGSPYQSYSPLSATFPSPQPRVAAMNGHYPSPIQVSQIHPIYQTPVTGFSTPMAQTYSTGIRAPGLENIAFPGRYSARTKIESPPDDRVRIEAPAGIKLEASTTIGLSKRSPNIQSPAKTDGGYEIGRNAAVNSPVKSNGSSKSTPSKISPRKKKLLAL